MDLLPTGRARAFTASLFFAPVRRCTGLGHFVDTVDRAVWDGGWMRINTNGAIRFAGVVQDAQQLRWRVSLPDIQLWDPVVAALNVPLADMDSEIIQLLATLTFMRFAYVSLPRVGLKNGSVLAVRTMQPADLPVSVSSHRIDFYAWAGGDPFFAQWIAACHLMPVREDVGEAADG